MTRQEILDLANLLTENKGKPLAQKLPQLFAFICQDICKRKRYWWRKVTASFQTVAGSSSHNYDLAASTSILTPTLSDVAIEEITTLLLVLPTVANVPQFAQLTPIFDDVGRVSILQNSQAAQPGRYCFLNNDWHNLTLDPSDAVYTIFLTAWAMPNPSTDDSTDSVPLIPPWGHNAIVEGMVAYIWENAYGLRDERTIDYKKRYEDSIFNLQMRPQFTTDANTQVISTGSNGGAIRST